MERSRGKNQKDIVALQEQIYKQRQEELEELAIRAEQAKVEAQTRALKAIRRALHTETKTRVQLHRALPDMQRVSRERAATRPQQVFPEEVEEVISYEQGFLERMWEKTSTKVISGGAVLLAFGAIAAGPFLPHSEGNSRMKKGIALVGGQQGLVSGEGTPPDSTFYLDENGLPRGCPVDVDGKPIVMTQGYGVGSHAPANIWGAVDLARDGNGDGQADPEGTKGAIIKSTIKGTIIQAKDTYPAGNHIWIVGKDEYEGVKVGYSHLKDFTVPDGEEVTPNTDIAIIGSTGKSSGDHVDYQVWKDGVNQNDEYVVGDCNNPQPQVEQNKDQALPEYASVPEIGQEFEGGTVIGVALTGDISQAGEAGEWNIEAVARAINREGFVIKPGETKSFLEVAGMYKVENGQWGETKMNGQLGGDACVTGTISVGGFEEATANDPSLKDKVIVTAATHSDFWGNGSPPQYWNMSYYGGTGRYRPIGIAADANGPMPGTDAKTDIVVTNNTDHTISQSFIQLPGNIIAAVVVKQ